MSQQPSVGKTPKEIAPSIRTRNFLPFRFLLFHVRPQPIHSLLSLTSIVSLPSLISSLPQTYLFTPPPIIPSLLSLPYIFYLSHRMACQELLLA